MKKHLLFLVLFVAAIGLHAQQPIVPANTTKQIVAKHMLFDAAKFNANKGVLNASRSTPASVWLNYGSSMDQFLGGGPGNVGPAVLGSNYLFPDSLGFGEFGTGNFAGCWIHHLGDVLDVKSNVFNSIDGIAWDATTTYSVDSMSILYGYSRTLAPTETDILRVTLFTNNTAANMPGYYFTGTTAASYGTDTLSFRAIKYTQATNTVNATGSYTFDIPLTDLDTAVTFYREKMFAVPAGFVVPANKLLGVDVQFIPGYTYALGDHIDYTKNAFFFTSYEENGASTFPTYFDCNMLAPNCDYNASHILPQDVRYNTAATWNGLFIPSYGYTAPFAFEHHLISYKVTSPPLGINEAGNSDFALTQNQPNPFNAFNTINYALAKSATKVSLLIFDVKGANVYDNTDSNHNSGIFPV